MIRVENIEVFGWRAAIRGMRNPMNSWEKSDSKFDGDTVEIGFNDIDLMKRLIKAGPEHRKFLRMIHAQMDVVAPLYWWSQYDTYKTGTVANSCSKMHKLTSRPLTWDDFSTEHLGGSRFYMERLISEINACIQIYNETKNKEFWYAAIQMIPENYNQKRTIDFNYEVAFTMIHQRTGHKLEEWNQFIKVLEDLPHVWELMS